MEAVMLWTVLELALQSQRDYDNPLWDVTVRVHFTAPSGKTQTVEAFWDGGRIWRVRFCPEEVGEWRWRSESSPEDAGLHGQTGSFRCVPYEGDNPLYRHGALRLSSDRHFFVHADGTPFFWLADTAWNGVLKAKPEDWERYLQIRRQQGFTVIQFVSTHWRAFPQDAFGETAYTGTNCIRINPHFFQRLDGKVAAINRHGLIAAPVLLWALRPPSPAAVLSDDDLIRLARYLVARWGAYQVVWILGGDGDYRGKKAERWKRIGRAVFGDRHDRLVTMHPQGLHWVADEFREEAWFDFIGYQSGHGDSINDLRWLVFGLPASEWRKEPPRPIVNLEPNYEAHRAYQSRQPFTAFHVRRALYWSLLVSPTAGVTYGHHGIWSWAEKPEEPLDHAGSGIAPPWHEAVQSEGAQCVTYLRRFFDAIRWWTLRPAPELLAEQLATPEMPHTFIAAAKSEDGMLAVLYTPQSGTLSVRTELLKCPVVVRWFNPRTGEWAEAGEVTDHWHRFTTPDEGDWLLRLRGKP
jgi:hypothetical protein